MSIITRFTAEMRNGWETCLFVFLYVSLKYAPLFCFFYFLSSLSLLLIAIRILWVSLQLHTQTQVRTRSERVSSCSIWTKTEMCRLFLVKLHSIKLTWKFRAAACRYTFCFPACGAAALDITPCGGATVSQQRLQPHSAEVDNVQEGAVFRLELF